ncbi:MAG TPA: hypothetical protein VHE81_06500 [Lacipirellulaceae bacterium]|jgi:hypothetical protein|nr:hypothetical protein [Lacipirellulaceae bacterium]
MIRIDRAVSLGTTCETAFQLRRVFGKHNCVSGVFDFQVTPPETVIEYLRRDFVGLFEYDDFIVKDGIVQNRRFGTQHMHEFRSGNIDRDFVGARSRHDHLCGNMRVALKGNGALLLAATLPPERLALANEIKHLVRDRNCDLVFSLEVLKRRQGPDLIANWQGDNHQWDCALSKYRGRPEGLTPYLNRQVKRFASHVVSGKF